MKPDPTSQPAWLFKTRHLIVAIAGGSIFLPLLALADNADDGNGGHRLADTIYNVAPFLILGVLFWFFFRKQGQRELASPLVQRYHAYLDRHEQHMQRTEQLLERIAVALEKDKP